MSSRRSDDMARWVRRPGLQPLSSIGASNICPDDRREGMSNEKRFERLVARYTPLLADPDSNIDELVALFFWNDAPRDATIEEVRAAWWRVTRGAIEAGL